MEKISGLTKEKVSEFKQKFGDNLISFKPRQTWVDILYSQFLSPLIYILIFVIVISVILGEFTDGLIGLTVLIINVLMGFYQEFNAEKTLVALRRFIKPVAIVIRGGEREEIETKDIVPLDIVVLASGDKVPADGHLISSAHLLVNEAILTGEEEAIPKSQDEQLFMGTTVVAGKGLLQVTKIGKDTEVGKISQSLSEIEDEETPLQKRLERFATYLAWAVLVICIVIFIFGIYKGYGFSEMLRIAIVLAIAAIPEGLPIAITVILALGMRRILKRKGLVRKLLAIETLGSTSVICTDKTGTLTEGLMQVVKSEFNDQEKAFMTLSLVNERKSSLEIALWEFVKKSGKFDPQDVLDKHIKIDEEPFDSEKKYSLAIIEQNNHPISFLLGAPEVVLSFCDIKSVEKTNAIKKIETWAKEGLRVLALAYKEQENLLEKNNYKFIGLIGIQDPIRKEVKEAIDVVRQAGIKVKIITGDYRKTAEFVAQNLGLEVGKENVLEAVELEEISEEELKAKIDKINLFTRVLPHQKLKIIRILQENGEVVAMTGDGVNDAPALKKADIGLVVANGTDVAKEAGDIILLDSNFQTIVAAIEEGRLIFANIKKVVGYVLSNSFAEIILIFGAMLMNFSSPLTVVQILWIQLICDGPPDIILSFEAKDKNIMKEDPRKIRRENILSLPMKITVLSISATVGILSLLIFQYFFNKTGNITLARTIAFATIGSVSLIYIFSFKDLKNALWKTENFWGNKYLFAAVIYGFVLILIAIYLPFFNRVLKTEPLNTFHWLMVFGVGLITLLIVELAKYISRRFGRL